MEIQLHLFSANRFVAIFRQAGGWWRRSRAVVAAEVDGLRARAQALGYEAHVAPFTPALAEEPAYRLE